MSWGVPGANPRVGRFGIAVAIGILILGLLQLRSAKVDFLPEANPLLTAQLPEEDRVTVG